MKIQDAIVTRGYGDARSGRSRARFPPRGVLWLAVLIQAAALMPARAQTNGAPQTYR